MAYWKLGGALVESGGKVSGEGKYAALIDDALVGGSAVIYYPAPEAFAVDPSSDWMLDQYCRRVAAGARVVVETDYVPRDEDIPPAILAQQADLKREPRVAGAVY